MHSSNPVHLKDKEHCFELNHTSGSSNSQLLLLVADTQINPLSLGHPEPDHDRQSYQNQMATGMVMTVARYADQ